MSSKLFAVLFLTALVFVQVQSFGLEDLKGKFAEVVEEINAGKKDWRQVLREQGKFFEEVVQSGQIDFK